MLSRANRDIKTKKIPQNILANARAENSDLASVVLAFSYATQANYTLDLVDVILHHLHLDKFLSLTWTETYTPTKEEFVEHLHSQETLCKTALYCATDAFSSILRHCPLHLREKTTQKLAPHLDQILAWFNYFQTATFPLQDASATIYLGDPTKPCESLWWVLHSEHGWPDLKQHLLLSVDLVVDFSLAAWMAEDPRLYSAPFLTMGWQHSGMPSPGECPIVELLLELLSDERSRHRIVDLLSGSDHLPKLFVDAAALRFKHISALRKGTVEYKLIQGRFVGYSPTGTMLVYIKQSLEVVRKLCDCSHAVSKRLFKSGFFEICTGAIGNWLSHCESKKDSDERSEFFDLTGLAQQLILRHRNHSAAHWKLSAQALQGMVWGGYLEIAIDALESGHPRGMKTGYHLVSIVQHQCHISPTAPRSIYTRFEETRGEEWSSAEFIPTPGHRPYWSALAHDSMSAASYRREDVLYICDNLRCTGDRRLFEHSRVCSSCRAVLYCSFKCQREDWKNLHQKECPSAREHLLQDESDDQPHYSLSTRLWQAELATRRAEAAIDTSVRLYPDVGTKIAAAPRVLELLGLAVDPTFVIRSIEGYVNLREINPSNPRRFRSFYFDARVRAMLNVFTKEEVDAGARIVEDICEFGGKKVCVVAMIQRDRNEGRFELVRCVSRVQ